MRAIGVIHIVIIYYVAINTDVESVHHLACGKGVSECELGHWMPWGHCNQYCGGGTQTRRKSICCNVFKVNSLDQCLQNCNIAKDHFEKITTESKLCGQHCYFNGHFNITENQCDCINGTWGRCCEKRKYIFAYIASITIQRSNLVSKLTEIILLDRVNKLKIVKEF
jgi:hypothetical protein